MLKALSLFVFVCLMGMSGALTGCDGRAVQEAAPVAPRPVVEDENTTALRQRAMAFGDLLQRLRTMTAEEGHYELQYFVAPGPELREKVMRYYREFSEKSKKATIITQQVDAVAIDDSGTWAKVTYSMVAKLPDGTEIPATQETDWQELEGKWYRAITASVARLQ